MPEVVSPIRADDIAIAARRRRSPLAGGLWISLFLFLCIAVAAAIALDAGLFVLVVFAAVGVALLWVFLGLPSYAHGRDGLFWWMFGLTFVSTFASFVSPKPLTGILEVWVLAVAVLGVPMLPWWLERSNFARWFVMLFCVFLGFAVASSFVEQTGWRSGVYQFLYDFKFPAMLLLGFRIGWSMKTDDRFWQTLCWLWLPIAAVVAVELVLPGAYFAVAKGLTEGGDHSVTANPLLHGLLNRVTGPFQHSGLLAFFCAYFIAMIAVRAMASPSRLPVSLRIALVAYLGLLILSGQRQETAAMVVAVGILLFALRFRLSMPVVIGAGALAVALFGGVLAVLGTDQIALLLDEWGFKSSVRPLVAARVVFYRDAIQLANDHFPLGTGLGTFGGVGAQKFFHHIYQQLGYERYWWYQLNQFLVDTYWPNFIAEAGWLGALAIFAAVLGLSLYALYRAWIERDTVARQLWGMAFAGQLMALSVSATSPLYSDPNLVGIVMLQFGIAFRYAAGRASLAEAGPGSSRDET